MLLSDDFDDNSIDPLRWQVVTQGVPFGAAAIETNQRMELTGRAHLVTAQEFDPDAAGGLRIEGVWTYLASPACCDFDLLQILTRSDGVPSGTYGETANGLEFRWYWDGSVSIGKRGPHIVLGRDTPGVLVMPVLGQSYRFRCVDAGTTASFTLFDMQWTPLSTASVDIVSDSTSVKRVVFHNRENIGGIRRVALDDVSIESLGTVVGYGCPGEGPPRVLGQPSSSQGFTIHAPEMNALCWGPKVVLFGACAAAPIHVPTPLACSSGCRLHLSPVWGSTHGVWDVGAGLPIGVEFCVQSACVSAQPAACFVLSAAVRVEVGS